MNAYLLATLARERAHELRAEYARGPIVLPDARGLLARVLRTTGDRLFRLGVALEPGVSPDVVAESNAV